MDNMVGSEYAAEQSTQKQRELYREAEMQERETGSINWPPKASRDCLACDGHGEITVNPTINNDPQFDRPARCAECGGSGQVQS